jgi:putative N-acetylmannosamine-6-phosphate epimerase
MKTISRIQISNFRKIDALDLTVPPGGIIAEGKCDIGKTSVLRALRSALLAQDIGPDAIRFGADRAEILVDLDDPSVQQAWTVRRVIGPKKSTVSVSPAGATTAKEVISSKQSYLSEIFGDSLFDPLDFYLAKPKERRQKLLDVMPVKTSRDELLKHAPDLPADFDATGHGFDVLERARKLYFDKRTEANRALKEKTKAAEAAAAKAKASPADDDSTPEAAHTLVVEAQAKLTTLRIRVKDAETADARTRETQDKIAKLRADAGAHDALSKDRPTDEMLAKAKADHDAAGAEVARLERELAAARATYDAAGTQMRSVEREIKEAQLNTDTAEHLRSQAKDLESAIGAGSTRPTEAEIAEADAELQRRLDAEVRAHEIAAGRAARAAATVADDELGKAEETAEYLDEVVTRLTVDAPKSLLERANGIQGLRLDGDDIYLDDVDVNALSGARQLDFAVDIARRAHADIGIIVTDGLERLDPERLEAFLRRASADGWQIFGTRVCDGDLEIRAVAADDSGPSIVNAIPSTIDAEDDDTDAPFEVAE